MDKRQYLIEALQAGAYKRKDWILSVFSVVRNTTTIGAAYPYALVHQPNDPLVYTIDLNDPDALTVIDGATKDQPLFSLKDRITLQPHDIPNVKETIETNLGNLLLNCMLFVYPFGDKIPFMTGKLKAGKIEALVASMLTPDPVTGANRDPAKIYVDEYLKYCEAVSAAAGLTQLCVPSASPKTMSVSPEVLKRRDELLLEYGSQLHDPAIVARIETELTQMDREWFKGDPGEGFLLSAKSVDVSRKRAFIMVGAETGFGDTKDGVDPIKKSLSEGWDLEQLPAMVNNLRSGSYNRGHETALGGESVKYFYRIFQNTRVVEDDCGSTEGLPWVVTTDNFTTFDGLWTTDGVALDVSSSKALIGKSIKLRSPMLCRTAAPSFCAKCVGKLLAANPTGLHIAASDVGSIFMSTFMGAMHGKALRTAKFDYRTAIT